MFTGKVEYLTKLIVKLAYLNVLWFAFCVLGGVLFGWAPATVAIFTILRKWVNKENPPLLSTFCYVYKKEFIRSNICGIVISCLAAIFLINLRMLLSQSVTYVSQVFLIGNGTLIVLFVLFLPFFFSVYVHYKGGCNTIFNKAILVTIAKLPFAILALILCLVWGKVLLTFPGLLFFYSVSVPALLITLISQHCIADNRAVLKLN